MSATALRTCDVCGSGFEPASHNQRYCSRSCYRKQENERYRSQTEIAPCPNCGEFFTRPRGRTHKVYCSEGCHAEAKHERFVGVEVGGPPPIRLSACPHGTSNVATCPACTFIARAGGTGHIGVRRIFRADPCAYCGDEGGTVDHILPTSTGGTDDWDNMTGACARCNSTKNQLGSILLSLLWTRAARAYHDLRRVLFTRG